MNIDDIKLAFDPQSLETLNVILGLVMFGVALDLRVEDFIRVFRSPKAPGIGLVVQFLVLPALTYGLTRLMGVQASIALGMILVASCPGGNMSNFITHVARGNTATSISMTAVSTVAAIFMMPINLRFWGGMHPEAAELMAVVQLDFVDMLKTIATLLAIPLVVGMTVAAKLPKVADFLRKPLAKLSLIFFAAFVVIAFYKNVDAFLKIIGLVVIPVALMNAVALETGYGAARAIGLDARDRRAVAIEVGIQNSGLGLIIIFGFFDGLGGMAAVAAWWGIWHIIAGLTMAFLWSRADRKNVAAAPAGA